MVRATIPNSMVPKYRYIQDPGHGWLEVPLAEVVQLNLHVSKYSYIDRNKALVYLEEDCDMAKFLVAKKVGNIGWKVWKVDHVVEHHTNSDSFVRRLPHWLEGGLKRA